MSEEKKSDAELIEEWIYWGCETEDCPTEAIERLLARVALLHSALTGLLHECDAFQGPELREDKNWGPLMRAADEALGVVPQEQKDA